MASQPSDTTTNLQYWSRRSGKFCFVDVATTHLACEGVGEHGERRCPLSCPRSDARRSDKFTLFDGSQRPGVCAEPVHRFRIDKPHIAASRFEQRANLADASIPKERRHVDIERLSGPLPTESPNSFKKMSVVRSQLTLVSLVKRLFSF